MLLRELGVFGFGLLEDRDVGVGIFPEGKKILIGGARFCGLAGEYIGSCKSQVRQRSCDRVAGDARMVDDFLEFGDRLWALLQLEVGQAAQINGNEIEPRGNSPNS